ncbi:N-acetylglucosamine kinase [Amnibacterium kyonggiense]|uniref:N-acetylglucosamine kinase-like BadF-type ATPase n=1 Tax=Amnibacterium kyonggiense TaxID=595671 RepID=A0A4R7FL80_9MICO|nr:BadF/BadG/BcrA/BcrD ATPase family protein [Amnibacterium kyonggiense]TDS77133.1 N-acetylglucosamine kinase-like BadF-type ATPase [Amnibacterium kyonggiense]
MARFLGVDGGGTKTAFVVADEHGAVLAEATAPSLYAFPADAGLIRSVLRQGLDALGIEPATIDRAFFALPGHGESTPDLPVLERVPGEVLGHERYAVGNDMVAGWAGSLGGADGINVVAGTGSIAYGEWAGRTARAGGWSEVFGDEGSGYWTAVRGLSAFTRMSDGRLPRGPLHARIREAVAAPTDLDVIGVVVGEWAEDRARIAALSRVVVAAAEDGDAVASAIVEEAGRELAALVQAVRRTLGAEGVVPVSYSGGMFQAPLVLAAFTAALGDAVDLRAPLHGPALGAALLARRLP